MTAAHDLRAQTAMPYFTGFDNATQKNGWQLFRKGATGTYLWTYTTFEPYSGTDCLYHDYPVGGTTMTDDWFVSPAFNLAAGGKLDSIRHYFSGFGTPGVNDTLAIYLITGNADPALATSKVLIHDFRGDKYNNDNTWRQTTNLTLPTAAGSSYLAIRYKTVNNWLTVKFDNIRLRSNAATGIAGPQRLTEIVSLFPNPATNAITIDTKADIAQTMICDLNGKIVYQQAFRKHLDLGTFGNGLYHMTLTTRSGERITQSFVKQ